MKQQIREELRQQKAEQLALRKEYKTATKTRQKEIRILLGKATLKDLLGDSMPVKVCKHCGKYAMTDSEAYDWHGMSCNTCTKVTDYYRRHKVTFSICGPHELLVLKKQCKVCKGTEGLRKDFWVCDVCLGKAIILDRVVTLTDLKYKPIAIQIEGQVYKSLNAASKATGMTKYSIWKELIGKRLTNILPYNNIKTTDNI